MPTAPEVAVSTLLSLHLRYVPTIPHQCVRFVPRQIVVIATVEILVSVATEGKLWLTFEVCDPHPRFTDQLRTNASTVVR